MAVIEAVPTKRKKGAPKRADGEFFVSVKVTEAQLASAKALFAKSFGGGEVDPSLLRKFMKLLAEQALELRLHGDEQAKN